jgi:hypothetical protein
MRGAFRREALIPCGSIVVEPLFEMPSEFGRHVANSVGKKLLQSPADTPVKSCAPAGSLPRRCCKGRCITSSLLKRRRAAASALASVL